MREQFGEEADLARFGDSIFAALFKGKTPEQAQAALQRLLKKVENHLFELNGRSARPPSASASPVSTRRPPRPRT